MVHEVGHFLDYSGLEEAYGEWASETPGVMDRWRAAVIDSHGIQRLRPLLEAGHGYDHRNFDGAELW